MPPGDNPIAIIIIIIIIMEKNQAKNQDRSVQAETRTVDLPNMPEALPLRSLAEQCIACCRVGSFEPKSNVTVRSDSFAYVMRQQTKIVDTQKGKDAPVHAKKAYRWGGVMAPLIRNFGVRRR